MKYRHLPAVVMLSGGAITCFTCILNQYETLYSLKALLAVLLIAWFLGTLMRHALIFITSMEGGTKKENEETPAEAEEVPEGRFSSEGMK